MFLIFRDELSPETALLEYESRHARARRIGPGQPVFLGDGKGRRAAGRLLNERSASFDLSHVESVSEPSRILCCAIPEPSRLDWLLQKATELGMTEFVPVQFARSEKRSIRMDRARKIVEEAASQSRRFILPKIHEPAALGDAVSFCDPSSTYLLHPVAEHMLSAPTGPAAFIVGPEGGFSSEELSVLARFHKVRLSHSILRVETAAICALSRSIV